MSNLAIAEKARAAHVKRWQIVRVAREQNLAEHSFMVAIISIEICKRIGLSISPAARAMMLEWALMHDIIEVVTGDINTLIKARMRGILGPGVIDEVEGGVCEEYDSLKANVTPIIRIVVKLADIIDAIAFLDMEGKGIHAGDVQQRATASFVEHLNGAKVAFPQYMWDDIRLLYLDVVGAE